MIFAKIDAVGKGGFTLILTTLRSTVEGPLDLYLEASLEKNRDFCLFLVQSSYIRLDIIPDLLILKAIYLLEYSFHFVELVQGPDLQTTTRPSAHCR